jgi:hypothetical protein
VLVLVLVRLPFLHLVALLPLELEHHSHHLVALLRQGQGLVLVRLPFLHLVVAISVLSSA